jgi:hypothetical protein
VNLRHAPICLDAKETKNQVCLVSSENHPNAANTPAGSFAKNVNWTFS